MAAAGGARRALVRMCSVSPATLCRTTPSTVAAQSPELAAAVSMRAARRHFALLKIPVEVLGSAQGSLMPLHSAMAWALLLTSMLGLKPGSWGWLSEGFATSL